MLTPLEKVQSVYKSRKLNKTIVTGHSHHSITRVKSLHNQSTNTLISHPKNKSFFVPKSENLDQNSINPAWLSSNPKKLTCPIQPTRQKADYLYHKLQLKILEVPENTNEVERKSKLLNIYLQIFEETTSCITYFAELLKTLKDGIISIYSENSAEDFQKKYIDQAKQNVKLLKSIEILKNEKTALIKKLNIWEDSHNKSTIESQNFQVKIECLESRLKQGGNKFLDSEKVLELILS